VRLLRRAILAITRDEQALGRRPRLSGVLWDMFSGSAPYTDIFGRMVHPAVIARGIQVLPRVMVETIRGATKPAVREVQP
jgi:hypothetical protein